MEIRPPGDGLRRTVLLVGAVAFLVRLIYLLEFHSSVFFSSPTLDAAWHDEAARRIASGHLLESAPYFRAPLYSWFLAIVYALGGTLSPWIPRLVQAALGAFAAAGVAWAAGRVLGSRRAGLVAGLVIALYGPLVFSCGDLLHEALLVPLLVAALVFLVRGQMQLEDEDAPAWPWFIGGLFLGLAAITRPSALVLVPAVILAPWFLSKDALRPAGESARRLILPVLAGVILPILPVTAINFITSGDWNPIASQGGINFYAGNNPQADGRHVIVPELGKDTGWGDFLPQINIKAQEAVGRKLRPSEISSYWTRRGFEWLEKNPGPAFRLYAVKMGALFSGYEVPNNRDIYVARRESLLLSVLVGRFGPILFPWGLLVPLSALGLMITRQRRRLYFFWSFAALYALSLLPFFIADRFRLPIVPFLAAPAAVGILALPEVVRAPLRFRRPIAAFAALFVIGSLAYGADTRGNRADSWHKLGEALYNKGDFAAALEAFNHAMALDPGDDLPRIGRAYSLQSLGQDSLAAADFRIAADHLPESWQAQFGYGEYLFQHHRPAEAVPYLERAAGLMPDRAELHRELGFAYEAAGNYPAAGLALAHALKLGEESAELHLSLGLAALHQGSPEMAEANWKRALELQPHHFRSLYNLGLLRLNQARTDEAGDLFRQAAAAAPENPLPHLQLARLFAEKGDRSRAADEARTALKLGVSREAIQADPLLSGITAELSPANGPH